jgi:hypothetical protein
VTIVETEAQRTTIDAIPRHPVSALGVEPARYHPAHKFASFEQVHQRLLQNAHIALRRPMPAERAIVRGVLEAVERLPVGKTCLSEFVERGAAMPSNIFEQAVISTIPSFFLSLFQ